MQLTEHGSKTGKDIHMDLKTRIENLLSEILSDKHECRVVIRFEKKVGECQK